MTELADVQDLGSCAFRRVGSSPTDRMQMEEKKRDAGSANRALRLLFCRSASLFAVRRYRRKNPVDNCFK